MENTMHRLLIALALLLLAPLAVAQVYKWTDASGTVHYAQAPPPQGTAFKKIKTSGGVEPLLAPPAQSGADGANGSAEADAKPAQPVADTPENRSKLCASLKSNLTALQGAAPVVMQQGGKSTALDTDQRKQQIGTAQAQYYQYCQTQ
jgi:hypothetical protein